MNIHVCIKSRSIKVKYGCEGTTYREFLLPGAAQLQNIVTAPVHTRQQHGCNVGPQPLQARATMYLNSYMFKK